MHAPICDMQIAEDLHLSFNHMMYRVLVDQFNNERRG